MNFLSSPDYLVSPRYKGPFTLIVRQNWSERGKKRGRKVGGKSTEKLGDIVGDKVGDKV